MEKLGRVQKGTQLGQRLRGITQPGHTTSYQIIEGVGTQERGGGIGGNGGQERGKRGRELFRLEALEAGVAEREAGRRLESQEVLTGRTLP